MFIVKRILVAWDRVWLGSLIEIVSLIIIFKEMDYVIELVKVLEMK